MAIGWLLVLQSVPWADVIRNAPKVADGAKRLWHAVSRNPPPPAPPAVDPAPALSPEAQAIAVLEARLASAEATMADMHGQMLASAELIKELADQNTQLIVRIESNRVRVVWLAATTGVATIVAIAALTLAVL